MKLLLLTLFVAAVTGTPHNRNPKRSVAASGSYPWQVSLRSAVGDSHFCGGSLISMNWVMTACHCYHINGGTNVRVAIGSTDIVDLKTYSGTFKCHPEYNLKTKSNDFAVIRLAYTATEGKYIAAVALPTSSQTFNGTALTSGWGTGTDGTPVNTVLLYTYLPLIDNADCNEALTPDPTQQVIDGTMQCAGNDFVTSCKGDFGDPLVQQVDKVWTLVGVQSWRSSRCTAPAVYARIAYARSWIGRTTGL